MDEDSERIGLGYWIALAIFFLVAAFGLFTRLDKPFLWADEAETALIGRNTAQFGYPTAWDGQTLITEQQGFDSRQIGGAYVWTWHPPLQYYVIGLSFKAFGEHPWSARFPFALAGFLGIAATAAAAWTISRDPRFLMITTALAVSSVPLFLYLRQARYYSLLFLGGALIAWGLARLWRSKPGAIALYGAGTLIAVLSHTVSGLILTGVSAAFAFSEPTDRKARARKIIAALVPTILFAVGWLILSDPLRTLNHQLKAQSDAPTFWMMLVNFHESFFPPVAWIALAFLGFRGHKEKPLWYVFLFPLAFGLTLWAMQLAGLPPFTRYLVGLVPFAFLTLSYVLWRAYRWSPAVGVLLTVLVTTTTIVTRSPTLISTGTHSQVVSQGPASLSYLGLFARELREPFAGTLEGISAFLSHAALPSDRILTNYERDALVFATGREVFAAREDIVKNPEWLIPRPNGFHWDFHTIPEGYEPFVLDVPNTLYENVPELYEHYFIPPQGGERLVLYHRLGAPLQEGFEPSRVER